MQYEGEFRVRGDFLSIHRIFFFFLKKIVIEMKLFSFPP